MALQPLTRRRSRLAWLAVAGFGSLSAYLLLARWFWPAEVFCHFRPLVGAAALAAAGFALGLRCRGPALALAALAWLCAGPTLALWWPSERAPVEQPPLRIATANLLWGSESSAGLASWLEREAPDVAFLCEVDPTRAAWIEAQGARYPHQIFVPPRAEWHANTFGRAMISRWPLIDAQVRSPGSIVDARIEIGGRTLRVLGAHTPRPGRARRTQKRNEVLDVLGELAGQDDGVVVLGDLNVTECSPSFARLLESGRLADSRAGRGPMGTWSVPMPWARWDLRLREPLDHVLVGSSLVTLDRRTGPDIGSDHLPVVADIAWRDPLEVTAPR